MKTLRTIFLTLGLLLLFTPIQVCNSEAEQANRTYNYNVILVKPLWEQAYEQAKKWESDSYLAYAKVFIDTPGGLLNTDEVIFIFHSPSLIHEELAAVCHKACSPYEYTTTFAFPECIHIDVNNIEIDSREALEIALRNGGSQYLDLENFDISLTLERYPSTCDGELIIWDVYLNNDSDLGSININVNAVTGEIIEMPQ